MSKPMIVVERLVKEFGEVRAVNDVSLEIPAGEFFSMLGPSGCGKTTTLRVIAGFEEPDAGRVLLDGEDVTFVSPKRRNVNMVFQDYALFPHMTVAENVEFGLRLKRVAREEARARVAEMLAVVRLEVGQLLDDAAIHYRDPVRHRQRLLLVVGDVDEGDADPFLDALQLDLHLLAQLQVEGTERLVEEEHLRPVRRRAGRLGAGVRGAGAFVVVVSAAARGDERQRRDERRQRGQAEPAPPRVTHPHSSFSMGIVCSGLHSSRTARPRSSSASADERSRF